MLLARFIILFLFLIPTAVFAGNPIGNFLFIKNEGQWDSTIFFKTEIPGGYLWITNNGLEYQLFDTKNLKHFKSKSENENARIDAIELQTIYYKFQNQVKSKDVKIFNPTEQSFNYFLGNDPEKWKTNVKGYSEIYIENVYEHIDFRLYSLDQSLKYEYIIKPHGNPNLISLNYTGVNGIKIENKNLIIQTKFGSIKEFEPFTYQLNGKEKKKIASSYKKIDEKIVFELGDYDNSKNLIIDPELVFSSYSGSISDNWSHTATYDLKGNLYAGGTVFGPNFPVSNESFQTKVGGTTRSNDRGYRTDIVITKYAGDGQKVLYSTFLGGEESEIPHSLIVNSKGQLVVFGTTSSNNFPTSSAAFDKTFNGGTAINGAPVTTNIGIFSGSDLFVSVISEEGNKLISSTYMGGAGNDGIHDFRELSIINYGDEFRGEVFVDVNDNIYVASVSTSNDFPVVNAVSTKKSTYDAVVFKLAENCDKLLFSTFLGGNAYDAAYGIRVNKEGAIFVCGVTKSSNFGTTSLAFKKTMEGPTDGFIVKIENFKITASTYIGTQEGDIAAFIDLDKDNNVYIFGLTTGDYNISTGVFSNPKSGQFIHCIDQNLNKTIYSSVFGSGRKIGQVDIVPTAFLVNDCGNVYVAGWGGNVNTKNGYNPFSTTNGLPISNNAYQKTTTGSNYYFAIFEKGFKSLLYGTYFGSKSPSNPEDERGDHLDGGTCRFDRKGNIYHSACVCKAKGFVDFPIKNAAEINHKADNCNMAAFKFNLDGLAAKFDLLEGTIKNPAKVCAPARINFDNLSIGAQSYAWFLNGEQISTAEQFSYNFTNAGSFEMKLIVYNKLTCNAIDSTFRKLEVQAFLSSARGDTTVCSGSKVIMKASGGESYNWTPAVFFKDPKLAIVELDIENSQKFTVEIKKGECTVKKEVTITVENTKSDFGATNSITICKGQSKQLIATGLADKFVWSGPKMSDSTQSIITVSPQVTSTYLVQAFYKDGCKPKKSIEISIDNSVKLDFSYSYTYNCNVPSELIFENLSSGAQKYFWQVENNLSIEAKVPKDFKIVENKVTTMTLKGLSANGCEFNTVKSIDLKNYDGKIPNVITPNNDKKNDTFVVGFPESKLEIFNKWGKNIFKAENYQNDWGNKINSGTYYYLLTLPNSKICKGWLEVLN